MKKLLVIFILCLASVTWGQGIPFYPSALRIGTQSTPPPDEGNDDYEGTLTITAPNGAYAANTIPGTTHGAGVGNGGSFYATNSADWFFKTVNEAKNVEIDVTYLSKNAVVLRINGNRGIGFVKSNNEIAPAIFTNVTQLGTLSNFNSNSLVASGYGIPLLVPGAATTTGIDYSSTLGDGTGVLTFGIKGVELYAKYNGVKFISVKVGIELHSGSVGVKGPPASEYHPVSSAVVRFLSSTSTYSTATVLDIRDFGAKTWTSTATVNVAVDSYKVVVANAAGIEVGDRLMIEVGGEAWPTGFTPFQYLDQNYIDKRGGDGVGGNYPDRGFNTRAELLAYVPPPGSGVPLFHNGQQIHSDYQIAWCREDRRIYAYYNNNVPGPNLWYAKNEYYIAYTVPKAYRGRVVAINGNTLTMDVPAINSTTNALVVVDSYEAIANPFINANYGIAGEIRTINIPAGTFYISEKIVSNDNGTGRSMQGWTVAGAGKDISVIKVPKGGAPVGLAFGDGYVTVKDFTIHSNGRKGGGHGFQWWGSNGGITQSMSQEPHNTNYFMGGLSLGGSYNLIKNTHVIDVYTGAYDMGISYSLFDSTDVTHTTGVAQYMAWQFVIANGGSFNTIKHAKLDFKNEVISGAESFGGEGNVFDSCHFINARSSCNSGQNMQIRNSLFEFTDNCASGAFWLNTSEPLISFNHNAYNSGYGGGVYNSKIIQHGYFHRGFNYFATGININSDNHDVTVDGFTYEIDSALRNLTTTHVRAVNSTADNVTVKNVTVDANCEGLIEDAQGNHSSNAAYNVNISPRGFIAGFGKIENINVRGIIVNPGVQYLNLGNIVSHWFQVAFENCEIQGATGCPVNL